MKVLDNRHKPECACTCRWYSNGRKNGVSKQRDSPAYEDWRWFRLQKGRILDMYQADRNRYNAMKYHKCLNVRSFHKMSWKKLMTLYCHKEQSWEKIEAAFLVCDKEAIEGGEESAKENNCVMSCRGNGRYAHRRYGRYYGLCRKYQYCGK